MLPCSVSYTENLCKFIFIKLILKVFNTINKFVFIPPIDVLVTIAVPTQFSPGTMKDEEVAPYVKKVYNIVKDKLQPIATEMMRWSGGYVAPKLLSPKASCNSDKDIYWRYENEFVDSVKNLQYELDENSFTEVKLFGLPKW